MPDRSRKTNVDRLSRERFDVLVIGAGINGAASAAAIAAAGGRVALIDARDFAAATSSNSSNFVWGGIKYLESLEIGLVAKLCSARNRLNDAFPEQIRETRFVAAVPAKFRFPPLFVYLGAWFYWLLGRGRTRTPNYLSRRRLAESLPAAEAGSARAAVEYSDCRLVDHDARLVMRFIALAERHGAVVSNYLSAVGATPSSTGWTIRCRDALDRGCDIEITAGAIVNACGPEVDGVNRMAGQTTEARHALSKGVHLIVPRICDTEHVLTFFASDGRMFFVAPFGQRSCIGTTDTRVDSAATAVSPSDRQFILENANRLLHLTRPLGVNDIIAERCGVRPLLVRSGQGEAEDWLKMSRKHSVEEHGEHRWYSIFGGKLTDCINVGEDIVNALNGSLTEKLSLSRGWYRAEAGDDRRQFELAAEHAELDQAMKERLWRRYGSSAAEIAESIAERPEDAEAAFVGSDYSLAELEFSANREWVTNLEDLFRRRSDIELTVAGGERLKRDTLIRLSERLFGERAEVATDEYLSARTGKGQ